MILMIKDNHDDIEALKNEHIFILTENDVKIDENENICVIIHNLIEILKK